MSSVRLIAGALPRFHHALAAGDRLARGNGGAVQARQRFRALGALRPIGAHGRTLMTLVRRVRPLAVAAGDGEPLDD